MIRSLRLRLHQPGHGKGAALDEAPCGVFQGPRIRHEGRKRIPEDPGPGGLLARSNRAGGDGGIRRISQIVLVLGLQRGRGFHPGRR